MPGLIAVCVGLEKLRVHILVPLPKLLAKSLYVRGTLLRQIPTLPNVFAKVKQVDLTVLIALDKFQIPDANCTTRKTALIAVVRIVLIQRTLTKLGLQLACA